jgi:cell division protein FtsW
MLPVDLSRSEPRRRIESANRVVVERGREIAAEDGPLSRGAHSPSRPSWIANRTPLMLIADRTPLMPEQNHDRQMFVSLVAVLLGFGVLMVHSASVTSRPTEFEQVYLSRHLTWLGVGLVAALVASRIPPEGWRRLAPWLFLATGILLVAVLLPGIGVRVKGAQRWFRVAGFSLQPSELAKVTLPLFLAALLYHRRHVLNSWTRGLIQPAWPIAALTGLVLLEPDLGAGVFLALVGAIALLVGGWPIRNFVLAAAPVVAVFAAVVVHKPYQLERLRGFAATWVDWRAAPYQLKQSLVTLGVGGVTGTGLGRGFQKLSFLPEKNTDFVFAVIGEELGLVGTLSVLGLWTAVYICGWRMLQPLPRGSFRFIAGFALLSQLMLQVVLNIAVVTAMAPPKGIALPLLSYGGSSLVASLLAIGIFCSLTSPPSTNAVATDLDTAVDSEDHSRGFVHSRSAT